MALEAPRAADIVRARHLEAYVWRVVRSGVVPGGPPVQCGSAVARQVWRVVGQGLRQGGGRAARGGRDSGATNSLLYQNIHSPLRGPAGSARSAARPHRPQEPPRPVVDPSSRHRRCGNAGNAPPRKGMAGMEARWIVFGVLVLACALTVQPKHDAGEYSTVSAVATRARHVHCGDGSGDGQSLWSERDKPAASAICLDRGRCRRRIRMRCRPGAPAKCG